MKNKYLTIEDVMEITGKKRTWSTNLVRELNNELEEQGFLTNRGQIPKNYFAKRMNIDLSNYE